MSRLAADLPVEILENIFSNLEADERNDLLRAAQVCPRWHAVAIPRAYCTIVFSSISQIERCARILSEAPITHFAKEKSKSRHVRAGGEPYTASAFSGLSGLSGISGLTNTSRWSRRRQWLRDVLARRFRDRFFSGERRPFFRSLRSRFSSFRSNTTSTAAAATATATSDPAIGTGTGGMTLTSSSRRPLKYGEFITNLDFSNVPKLTDKLFRHFVKSCPHLQSISLWHCYLISDNAITVLSTISTFESLELGENDYLTGSFLSSFRHETLRSLRIGPRCRALESRTIVTAAARGVLNHLTRLSLNVTGIPVSDLIMLITHIGSGLTHLQLQELRPDHDLLTTLTYRCTRLRHLDISSVRIQWTPRSNVPFDLPANLVSFNASGLRHIQPFLQAMLASTQTLRKLYLAGARLGSERLTSLIARCPNLERLDVSSAKLNTEACQALSQAPCAAKLTKLRVRDCYWLSDEGLEYLARAMPKITILDVSGCFALTSNALHLITRSWGAQLKALQIHRCRRFDDRFSLFWIPDRCRGLRCLDLGDQMLSIDDGALMYILSGCPDLVELSVRGITFSEATKEKINPMLERANRRHWRQNSVNIMW